MSHYDVIEFSSLDNPKDFFAHDIRAAKFLHLEDDLGIVRDPFFLQHLLGTFEKFTRRFRHVVGNMNDCNRRVESISELDGKPQRSSTALRTIDGDEDIHIRTYPQLHIIFRSRHLGEHEPRAGRRGESTGM